MISQRKLDTISSSFFLYTFSFYWFIFPNFSFFLLRRVINNHYHSFTLFFISFFNKVKINGYQNYINEIQNEIFDAKELTITKLQRNS